MNIIRSMPRTILYCVFTFIALESYSQSPQASKGKETDLRHKLETGEAGISYYNTACYFALAGQPALAFNYLMKAANDEAATMGNMEKDEDLISLHNDPRWPSILKRLEDNLNRQKKASELFFNKKSFWESATFETPYKENITENEKIAGLSKFWSEAKYNFANFDLVPHLNFDSLYFAFLPKVRNSTSTLEYYMLMAEFVAMLGDSHTNAFPPRELTDSLYARPLLRTRLIEDKVLVIGVYDPALSQKGISIGQEVISVNGLPVKEYAARYVAPYQSASTIQDKTARVYDFALLAGSISKPIRLQLRDASNVLHEHRIFRVKPEERGKKTQLRSFEYRLLKGNIAYVALNTFGNDSAAIEFASKFDEISKANAIIFDLRNNGGGNTDPGWTILSYLIDKNAEVHSSYTRDYKPTYRAWNINQPITVSRSQITPYKKYFYTKPVIVLTSPRTFSAAEDFAAAFKTMNRGLIIGEASGGSSGQPLFIRLPGNGSARICTKRDMLGNGEDFVGKGVQPDKVVISTISDVRKGLDPQLQAAIKELSK